MEMDDGEFVVGLPAAATEFYLLHSVQTGSRASPAFHLMRAKNSSLEDKAAEARSSPLISV
jgi:hypothetical protein